jgi:hypothetical protein
MLRRYWPPTSNSAFVICPSEQHRTAAGHHGNLPRLRAQAPWRRMVEARVA